MMIWESLKVGHFLEYRSGRFLNSSRLQEDFLVRASRQHTTDPNKAQKYLEVGLKQPCKKKVWVGYRAGAYVTPIYIQPLLTTSCEFPHLGR